MNLIQKIQDQYSELWKAIIRPPRDSYELPDLGPTFFRLHNIDYYREDLQLVNDRNIVIECSHFKPTERFRAAKKLPCVIYLHGNSSSRVESTGYIPELLSPKMTVFALDFSGSGHSGGEYVSLGWWEREDLATVISYLRNQGDTSYIGLWGRSMGAVTALLHGHRDPSIAGMVLDSPFANLRLLAEELVEQFLSAKLPKFVISTALTMLRNTIINKAQFDIDNLSPADYVDRCFIPAFFVVSDKDTFILPHHGEDLHAKYAGEKQIVTVKGDHNSVRPQSLIESVQVFFQQTLQRDFTSGNFRGGPPTARLSNPLNSHVNFATPDRFFQSQRSNGQYPSSDNISSNGFSSDSEFFKYWEVPTAPTAPTIYPSLSDQSHLGTSSVSSSSCMNIFPSLTDSLLQPTTGTEIPSVHTSLYFPSSVVPSLSTSAETCAPSVFPSYPRTIAPTSSNAYVPSAPSEKNASMYPSLDANSVSTSSQSLYPMLPSNYLDTVTTKDWSSTSSCAPSFNIFSLRENFRPPERRSDGLFPSTSLDLKLTKNEDESTQGLPWSLESLVKTNSETMPSFLHNSSDSTSPEEVPKLFSSSSPSQFRENR